MRASWIYAEEISTDPHLFDEVEVIEEAERKHALLPHLVAHMRVGRAQGRAAELAVAEADMALQKPRAPKCSWTCS